MITETVRIATIVQTDLILAVFPVIPRVADTSRGRKLYRTMPSMRTVVVAVPYGTVVVDEGRRALARAKPIADAVRFAERAVLSMGSKGTRHARHVDLVLVVVRMVIPGLAAVLADLFVRVLVHVTEVARTGNIGTVRSIITAVALAETVTTITLIVAVVRAVVHT